MSDTENGLPFEPWDWGEEDPKPLNDLDTPKGGSELIREAIRQDLAPRTSDLVDAPLVDDVDGGEALAGYLLRAAETGENAESCLGRLGDLEDLTEDEQAVLARTREVLFNAAAWIYYDRGRAKIADVVDDLERAVDAISAAAGPDEQPEVDLSELMIEAEDTNSVKHPQDATAIVEGPLVNTRLGTSFCENISAEVRLLEVGSGTVSLSARVEGTREGGEVEHSVAAHFSPSQAEALAADLVEWADAAREYQEGDQQ